MNHLIRAVTAALVIGVCGTSLASAQPIPPNPLMCTLALAGTVRSKSGSPIKAARVNIEFISAATPYFTAIVRTDANGAFTIGVPGNAATLDVQAPGYQDAVLGLGTCQSKVSVALSPSIPYRTPKGKLMHGAPARISQSQYYSYLEAFETTNASRSSNCSPMINAANNPAFLNDTRYLYALDAAQCLNAVGVEAGAGSLPTKIPLRFLQEFCEHLNMNDRLNRDSCTVGKPTPYWVP
jgi:hypothetical protein